MSRPVVAFRYLMLAPPKPPTASFGLTLATLSMGSTLSGLSQGSDARTRLRDFARSFMNGAQFLRDPAELALHRQVRAFLDALASRDRFDRASLSSSVRNVFGQDAGALAASASFRADARRLADAIVVLTLASSAKQPGLLSESVRLYRAIDLISKLATSNDEIEGLKRRVWERVPLELPAELLPAGSPPAGSSGGGGTPQTTPPASPPDVVTAKLVKIEQAVHDLLSLGARDFVVVGDDAGAGVDKELLAVRARIDALERALSDLKDCPAPGDTSDKVARAAAPETAPAVRSTLVARPEAVLRLRASTRSLLTELAIDLDRLSVPVAVERLRHESEWLGAELASMEPALRASATVHMGTMSLPAALLAAPQTPTDAPAGDLAADVPPGVLKMCGIGNLLLTAMNVIRYEAGEIAHIENVLIGEEKERETRRLRRTEETFTREVEMTKEEERDLQTTERMEMQREAQNTLKESEDLKIGATISAAYGPFVQASFNTQYETQSSSEDMARNAANFSREVMERATLKITERVREEQTIRVIQEFEERNRHLLSGAGRDEHIVGLFQWIDKVYHAQVFDYGVRLICEVVVPEPAHFLQRAVFEAQQKQKSSLVAPDPIDFAPESLNSSNYGTYAAKYEAKSLQPPPEPMLTLCATFESEDKSAVAAEGEEAPPPGSEFRFTNTKELKIPAGYHAVEGWAATQSGDASPNKGDAPYGVVVHVGRSVFPFIHEEDGAIIKGDLTFPLDDEVDSIPIVVLARNVTHYVASVEITCHRTEFAVQRWRLQTFEALVEAYKAKDAEYRERLAEMAAQQGITFAGRNPEDNRRIEKTELKRLTLSMITREHLGGYGAYKNTVPVPQIDFDKAEQQAVSIKFFECLFEWENIVYQLYAYFWSFRNRWATKLLIEDTDPLHRAFHAAGAARVQLAVRPDYEQVFLHYMNTGEIWQGAELPPITNPFQTALMAEIMERRGVEDPHQRIPVGEPWEVRLPTTLVRVSPTGNLPRWEVDEEGNFTPVEEEA